ncbi:post-PEP-CTERM-1 domain-containing protein [Roseateles sp.]|uniref:post-PEP-CTERM-1 domain-containing protein n=1 Tax=Roseateles sp. TaxID=1971397 RepID=UPI003BADA1BB
MTFQTQLTLLLAALGMASSAQACEPCDAQAPSTTPHTMTVVRDADTGQLRAPTAAEAAALQSRAKPVTAARGASQPAVRAYASGAHSARLPGNLASFSVVTREPDGTLKSACLQGEEAATDAIRSVPPAGATSAKREAQ